MLQARDYLREEVEKQRTACGSPEQLRLWLIDWVMFLRDRAIVMLAQVPEEADAYTIFETLNARGTDLAIADLLKNHLFSRSGDVLDIVKYMWSESMRKTTDNSDDPRDITGFLRHYWNSRNELSRESMLYRRFRDSIGSQEDASDFAQDLETAARHYEALLTPEHQFWSDHGAKAHSAHRVLFDLGLEQNRPLLLAAMTKFASAEFSRLIMSLVPWAVRGIIVGGIGKGKTEETYARAALAVTEGECRRVEDVFERYLASIVPNDTEFGRAFQTYSPPTTKRSQYLLRALHEGADSEGEPYLTLNPRHQELTIEHILPRRAEKSDWPDFQGDRFAEYVSMLGNLVLLPKTRNARLGNRPNRQGPVSLG